MMDTIEIRRLRTPCHIGVPDTERATPQTLFTTLLLTPSQGFDGLDDNIARTIDYHAISLEIQALAAARPRRLIETLATDIAHHLLSHHPLRQVSITLEKHILPDTDCVAVHLTRSR